MLRCLKCLHGTELPDITPRGRQEGLKKTLVVCPAADPCLWALLRSPSSR